MRALLLLALLAAAMPAHAGGEDAYARILGWAAQGRLAQALAACATARALMAPDADIWTQRIRAACALLALRQRRAVHLAEATTPELQLARAWIARHPAPAPRASWPYGLASVLVPGLGHLLLGRKQDALVAAMFVWPMLVLTLWAWRRRMGPVVVFFALITLWLWSGVVFSSVSLAERGDAEDYLRWWAALWQASGLPGRPW